MGIDHPWTLSIADAVRLQSELAAAVVREDRFGPIRILAGVDVAYGRRGAGWARAAAVAFAAEDLSPIEEAVDETPLAFPYVPGLLSFREAPAAIGVLGRMSRMPDLLLCDGQGIAHPRRLGLASHLGLVLDRPTIGVAKSRLIGDHEEPGQTRGDWVPLRDRGETIGAVLRTRAGVRPLYISIGHRISLETAIRFVLECTGRYRLPEPTRLADHLSKRPIAPQTR